MATKKTINIPLGATIRVTRDDSRHELFVFRGSDVQGVIYEDSTGARHDDIGVYVEIAVKTSHGWDVL